MKIYVLKDPVTNEIRYVGVTGQTLAQRLSQHICTAKNTPGRYVCNWIRSLLKENKRPVIEQIDEVPDNDWERWEIYYISHYRNMGYKLTNTDKGGKGVVNASCRGSSIKRGAEKHKKPIYQMDSNCNIIAEYPSTQDAIISNTGFKYSNISNAIIYRIGAYGYLWCRKSDYNNYKPNSKYMNPKNCGQIKIQSNLCSNIQQSENDGSELTPQSE